ncbi:PilZ domain-containing protein [Jiella avicenniae]|uniref:PilZ domain-containing protein n=1 Tax=Jiella avicenniae TaxID=2907202 RepID=UPI003B845174
MNPQQIRVIIENSDLRGNPRRILQIPLDTTVNDDIAIHSFIHNISVSGLLIETEADLSIGELIDVDVPETGSRLAEVVWSSGRLFGCRFKEAISQASVNAVVLRAPFTRPSSVSIKDGPGNKYEENADHSRGTETLSSDAGRRLTDRNQFAISGRSIRIIVLGVCSIFWVILFIYGFGGF